MTKGFTDTTKTAPGTTEPRECEGAACGRDGTAGRARDLAAAGSRLCPNCRLRLTHDLQRLPRLHDDCGRLLTGTDRPRDRTSGGPLPGMPFNTAAADARSAIVGLLRSWAALVIEERGVGAPRDTPPGSPHFCSCTSTGSPRTRPPANCPTRSAGVCAWPAR